FRSYSKASLRRRVMHRLGMSGLPSIMAMTDRVLRDQAFFVTLLNDLTVNVTEMFRDPEFYRAFREEVVPVLKTFPFIKIWHAGCATGEEIYSMAILLEEEGLFDRAMLYATDIDKNVLAAAKKGIYSYAAIKVYSDNYRRAGGKASLADYYTAKYDGVIMDQRLKRNIVFADHDLATDQVFGEMNVIVCRNVLIYFDRDLQQRVFKLFLISAFWMVESRCAITIEVLFRIIFSRASCTRRSLSVSRAEVASSKIIIGGFLSTARAMDRRCFCPPLNLLPLSPILVWYPSG